MFIEYMAMPSASRHIKVTVVRLGAGRRARSALLHGYHTRHHSWDNDQRLKQTTDIQRCQQISSSYRCWPQQQVNEVCGAIIVTWPSVFPRMPTISDTQPRRAWSIGVARKMFCGWHHWHGQWQWLGGRASDLWPTGRDLDSWLFAAGWYLDGWPSVCGWLIRCGRTCFVRNLLKQVRPVGPGGPWRSLSCFIAFAVTHARPPSRRWTRPYHLRKRTNLASGSSGSSEQLPVGRN